MHKNAKKILRGAMTDCAVMVLLLTSAGATSIAGSQIGAGVKSLLSDASRFLVILCPIVAGCMAVYFVIRRSIADEQDGKMWAHRITVSIVCGVAGMLISGIIALVFSIACVSTAFSAPVLMQSLLVGSGHGANVTNKIYSGAMMVKAIKGLGGG